MMIVIWDEISIFFFFSSHLIYIYQFHFSETTLLWLENQPPLTVHPVYELRASLAYEISRYFVAFSFFSWNLEIKSHSFVKIKTSTMTFQIEFRLQVALIRAFSSRIVSTHMQSNRLIDHDRWTDASVSFQEF